MTTQAPILRLAHAIYNRNTSDGGSVLSALRTYQKALPGSGEKAQAWQRLTNAIWCALPPGHRAHTDDVADYLLTEGSLRNADAPGAGPATSLQLTED